MTKGLTHLAAAATPALSDGLPLHRGEHEFFEWCQRPSTSRTDTRALLGLVSGALGVASDR
jgi:hypothetical protein